MPAGIIAAVRDGILLVTLGVAVYTDLTRGKVYNSCTLVALGLGLLVNFVAGAVEPAQGNALIELLGRPLISSLAAVTLAFGVFGLAYLMNMLGAGDVKLMCAVASLKGLEFFLYAAIFTACAGAVIALGVLVWRGRLLAGLKSSLLALFLPWRFRKRRRELPDDAAELTQIPYATAIAAGTLTAWATAFVGVPYW
jgi:prepilin peptidase CpaA